MPFEDPGAAADRRIAIVIWASRFLGALLAAGVAVLAVVRIGPPWLAALVTGAATLAGVLGPHLVATLEYRRGSVVRPRTSWRCTPST